VNRPEREHYTATLGIDPAEIARVRLAVRRMAERHGFAERAGDLVLALDEIVANAQEHGRAPVAVRAWTDGRLIVEVCDVGEGFDRTAVWSTHPPERRGARGRGLWIARQLADHIDISVEAGGTRVRLEVSPDPHIGA
jgi:anti-sigma regulatory factor (Ser/Thr protein kinase)